MDTPASLPSLRDGTHGWDRDPVVSLRSTTGYKLLSLRDPFKQTCAEMPVNLENEMGGTDKVIAGFCAELGIKAPF